MGLIASGSLAHRLTWASILSTYDALQEKSNHLRSTTSASDHIADNTLITLVKATIISGALHTQAASDGNLATPSAALKNGLAQPTLSPSSTKSMRRDHGAQSTHQVAIATNQVISIKQQISRVMLWLFDGDRRQKHNHTLGRNRHPSSNHPDAPPWACVRMLAPPYASVGSVSRSHRTHRSSKLRSRIPRHRPTHPNVRSRYVDNRILPVGHERSNNATQSVQRRRSALSSRLES